MIVAVSFPLHLGLLKSWVYVFIVRMCLVTCLKEETVQPGESLWKEFVVCFPIDLVQTQTLRVSRLSSVACIALPFPRLLPRCLGCPRHFIKLQLIFRYSPVSNLQFSFLVPILCVYLSV